MGKHVKPRVEALGDEGIGEEAAAVIDPQEPVVTPPVAAETPAPTTAPTPKAVKPVHGPARPIQVFEGPIDRIRDVLRLSRQVPEVQVLNEAADRLALMDGAPRRGDVSRRVR